MIRILKTLPLCSIFLLLISFSSYSQTMDTKAIDEIFKEWDNSNSPGCGLGIIQDGHLTYAKGFGMANLEYDIPNDEKSVFRIGSTSKQFTAACIVLLAQQEKLNLSDPLSKFYPDFPSYADQITVRHLLNHTSGIRDYLQLSYLRGLGNDDFYTDQDIMKWLVNQTDLNFLPGEEFTYSNSGYWLLGQIVEEASGMNMAEYAKKEIFEPLRMDNTHFHNDHNEIVKKRASGYYPKREGGYRISMTTLDMIGDGGIFTSIEDIKKWDDAYYNSTVLNSDFWTTMTEQGQLNNGEKIDYAAGLFISDYNGLRTIRHGGAFVGFRAELLRFPDQKTSIAIFANRGDASPSRMANQVADILLGDQFIPEEPRENKENEETTETENEPIQIYTLEQVLGDYEVEPGVVLEMIAKGDSLDVTQTWNGSNYRIVKTTGNSYQIPNENGLTFTFSGLSEGSTQTLTIVQGGRETVTTRKKEIDLSGIDFNSFSGSYFSKELDATYNVKNKDQEVKVSIGKGDAVDATLAGLDQFQTSYGLLRFQRENGTIIGFELDSGRVKNLKFVKQ